MNLGQQGMFGYRIAHSCLGNVIRKICNADAPKANNRAQAPPIQSSVESARLPVQSLIS